MQTRTASSSRSSAPFTRLDVQLTRVLPALVWSFSLWSQFFYLPGTDVSWLLTVGRRLLEGQQLYSADIVEVNTPPIMYVMAGAVWIADALGVEPLNVWRFSVGGFIAGTVALLARILGLTLQSRAADLRLPILAIVTTLLTCLPGDTTGQREHLVVLCLLPYTFLSALRAGGGAAPSPYGILAGALAGFGVWLKPHHLLALILVECGVAFSRRSLAAWRAWEPATAAVVIAAYAVWIAWRVPQFYFSAVPLAWQFYASAGRFNLRPVHFSYVAAAVLAVYFCRSPRIAVMQVRQSLLAGLGSFAAFVLQDKGWRYQALPYKTFLLIAAGIGVAAVLRTWTPYLAERGGRWARTCARVGASLALLTPALMVVWVSVRDDQMSQNVALVRALEAPLQAIQVKQSHPLRLLVLTEGPFPAFPLVTSLHAEWTSRFSCLWMLRAIIDSEVRGLPRASWMIDGRHYLTRSVAEDLARGRPDVVLVRRTGSIDFLLELLTDESFRAEWASFRPTRVVNGYEFFQRIGSPISAGPGESAEADRLASQDWPGFASGR